MMGLDAMELEQIHTSDQWMHPHSEMAVFGLPATCPRCGGLLELVNTTANASLTVAVLSCGPCRKEWEVTARITLHRHIPLKGIDYKDDNASNSQAAHRASVGVKGGPVASETVRAVLHDDVTTEGGS